VVDRGESSGHSVPPGESPSKVTQAVRGHYIPIAYRAKSEKPAMVATPGEVTRRLQVLVRASLWPELRPRLCIAQRDVRGRRRWRISEVYFDGSAGLRDLLLGATFSPRRSPRQRDERADASVAREQHVHQIPGLAATSTELHEHRYPFTESQVGCALDASLPAVPISGPLRR
jgi:hypothetical protein